MPTGIISYTHYIAIANYSDKESILIAKSRPVEDLNSSLSWHIFLEEPTLKRVEGWQGRILSITDLVTNI